MRKQQRQIGIYYTKHMKKKQLLEHSHKKQKDSPKGSLDQA